MTSQDTKQSKALRGTQEPKVLDVFASTDELTQAYQTSMDINKDLLERFRAGFTIEDENESATITAFLACEQNLKGRLAVFKAWLNYLYEERDLKKVAPNSTIVWNEALESRIAEQIRRIEECLK